MADKHQILRERIVSDIRRDVFAGRYDPSQPLREQVLAERFAVSRGPIRDALLQLTREGLLVAKPHCGVRVGDPLSPAARKVLVDVRRRIETFALRRGADRIDDDRLDWWRGNLEAFRDACEHADLGHVVELDMAFHRSIVELPQEDHLEVVWVPIMTKMVLPYSRHGKLIESYREHRGIVEAIRAGDLSGAVRRLRANIQ